MADNVTLNAGSGGAVLATDDVASVHYQRVKLVDGTLEGTGAIGGDATNGLDVDVTRLPSGTVAGSASLPAGANNIGDVDVLTLPALVAGTANIGDVDVLTVPAPLSTTGGGVEATALRVTVASDSTGVLSVDDNGGALTVDGTVTANAGTGPWPVTDNAGSLTVDSGQLPAALVGGRLDVVVGAALPAGTAAIGKLAANSGVDIGDVDVTSLPALPTGTNSIGTVVDGGSGKTLKRAVVNTSTSGADVVAAVASKRIKVYSYAIQATGTVNVNLRDGAAGAAMTLTWNLQAREGATVGAVNPPAFLFGTTAGNALQVVLSAAVTVGIEVTYWDDDGS